MKRKFLALFMVVAMSTTMMVGCGEKPSEDTTNETKETIEATTEVEEVTTKEVETEVETTEEETVEVETDAPEVVETTEEEYVDDYGFNFIAPDEVGRGFMDKFVFKDNESMTRNNVHTEDKNGNTMDFTFVSEKEIGERQLCWDDGIIRYELGDNNLDKYLYAYTSGGSTPEEIEEMKNMDKNTIISFENGYYVENGLYERKIEDNILTFTIEIKGNDYSGYAFYMISLEDGRTYQFRYLEKDTIFDKDRALAVINSIEFLDATTIDLDSLDYGL